MEWLGMAVREVFGLFVDDVPFSAALLAWTAAGKFAVPMLPIPPRLEAPLLFAGYAGVLAASVLWTVRVSDEGRP